MSLPKVLVIDDEELIRWSLNGELQKAGYQVFLAENGEKGMPLFRKEMPDVVLCDLRLPGTDGLTLIREMLQLDRETPIIMLTAHGSIESAIEAIRLGAYNYITKPFDLQELLLNIRKALESRQLKKEVSWLRHEAGKQLSPDGFVAQTTAMKELMAVITRVAESDAPTILLQGESGTGKNAVARMIHFKSRRSHSPFMEINCASLPETLIESELFGHEKGSFTDARQMKRGLFEVARTGTLFLDEIAEISTATQAKLLQAIEGHRFRRVGGLEDIETDVRIIAAASADLKEAVTQKRFREDLYFRLQLIPINIPPLRERTDDIPLMADYFVKKFNRDYHRNIKGVSPEAMILLKTYSWPGNVRELRNIVERIAILENDVEIGVAQLPYEIKSGSKVPTPTDYVIPEAGINLETFERQLIEQALQKTAGNQSRAARLLGITRHTLRYRMEKFGLH